MFYVPSIYFPYFMSSGIKVPGYSDQQNLDMFYKLVDLFNDERVIYTHFWNEGDIILNLIKYHSQLLD